MNNKNTKILGDKGRKRRRKEGDGEVGTAGYNSEEKEGKKSRRRKSGGRTRADAHLDARYSDWYVQGTAGKPRQ